MKKKQAKERMSLDHKEWPGYKKPFVITCVLGVSYLILAFSGLLGSGGGGH